ncbi:MAG: hypothetical protein JSS09_00210 [Verrucomicrobia bacterium]|nr:hypothetical protein [Verrucomicrobiota bacterium]
MIPVSYLPPFHPADLSKIDKLKENEYILLKEEGVPKAIIGNKQMIEPIIESRKRTVSIVFFTQNLAITILKSTDPLSLRDKQRTKELLSSLHQQGNPTGIRPLPIGQAYQHDIVLQSSEDDLVPATVNKRIANIWFDRLFSAKQAPQMSLNLIQGVKTLHAKDIYHLNIQPINVLYDQNGAYLANFKDAIDLNKRKGNPPEITTLREQFRQQDLLDLTETLCQIAYIAAQKDPNTTHFKSAVLLNIYTQGQIDSIKNILSTQAKSPSSLNQLELAFSNKEKM